VITPAGLAWDRQAVRGRAGGQVIVVVGVATPNAAFIPDQCNSKVIHDAAFPRHETFAMCTIGHCPPSWWFSPDAIVKAIATERGS